MNKCIQCGKCCQSMFLMGNNAYTENGLDHKRWAEYHGLTTEFFKNEKELLCWGVTLPIMCEKLKQDKNNSSLYYCSIYKHRPLMCREYTGKEEFPECGYNK